jgi:hypothetical protein
MSATARKRVANAVRDMAAVRASVSSRQAAPGSACMRVAAGCSCSSVSTRSKRGKLGLSEVDTQHVQHQ